MESHLSYFNSLSIACSKYTLHPKDEEMNEKANNQMLLQFIEEPNIWGHSPWQYARDMSKISNQSGRA